MKKAINILFTRRKLVLLLFTLIFGFGIYSYLVIPKQEMPAIDTPYMVLTIVAPSVNASDLEQTAVMDIEALILTYDDVSSVQSTIYDNYAVIITLYNYSALDPDSLSADIYAKISELSLNDHITEISYSSNFDDPHVIFALYSNNLSDEDILSTSERFKNKLLMLDQIKTVEINSVFQNEVVITLNTETLNMYSLDLLEIYQILYANSLNIPLGGIKTIYGTISISGNTEIDSIETLENIIIIPEIPGTTEQVTLSDLGTIELESTSTKIYEFNGEKAVFLSIYFKDNVDFTKLGDDVLAIKDGFITKENNPTLSIDEMLFLPDYVNDQINNVFTSLLICIAVVMIIVLMGIGVRNSMLIIITIPLIIFATIGVLYIFGFELHKLTIVGLIVSIGILVDNSIVITEGIKRNLDLGYSKVESAKKAIHDNSIPVLSSTLTTIAAFAVLVMLPGFLGEIVASMPLTVIIAISLSYVVSISLSPVLATLFLKEGTKQSKPKTTIHETNIKNMIAFTIRFPLIWILVSLVLLVGSVYFAFQKQSLDLYPNDERSVLYIDFENETLGDLDSSKLLSEQIINTFKDNPNMLNYATSIGGNLPSFHFSAKLINERNHLGRIYINFDYEEDELLAYKKQIESELSTIENSKITVNILELSPPIAPVRLTLRSDDLAQLDLLSTQIFSEISSLDNVKSYTVTESLHSLKYDITYDFEAISNHFLTKAQIDQIIAINLNGLDLNIYTFNEDTINISITSDIQVIEDVLSLQVYSDTLNQSYPLDTFISIASVNDYSIINRLNNLGTSHIDLYYKDDSSLTELENDVKEIVSTYNLGNVSVNYGGENEMFTEISSDLIRASIIALIIIYIIMFIQFNNFIKPLIVYLTIPLSFSGSFLFLIIFNSPITATSLVGMVSLIGVTVNTGILLVEYISRNHHNGDDIKTACVDAVYLRFRPIMLTSLTTILGLIPLLITGGNFFRPLAITFMGGMVTSTILTIFLVPSVYYLIYHRKPKTTKKV